MARAALIAFLVALTLSVGVVGMPTAGSPAAEPVPTLDDVAILTLGENTRAGFAMGSMDVATAMAVQHEATAARLDRYALGARLERAPSTDDRKELLFQAATDVEIRIATLRDTERRLRSAYAQRDLDTGPFVRRLALVHARAGELRTTLDTIQRQADEIPEFSLRSRVRLLDAALFGFEAPVRGRLLATFRGDAPPTRLFVQASDQGIVLATIEEGRYVREAHRADNRDTETISAISLNEAAQRTSELYPVAYNTSTSIRTGINGLSAGLFRIDIELREGVITAYLDGATGDVFFEVQERRLDLLGPRPAVSKGANGTEIVVNRSYPGGPLEVAVTDNATGEPLATTVYVDGHGVETGPDGVVWTLTPASVAFEVTAVGPDGNVTVSVRPFQPRSVGTEA